MIVDLFLAQAAWTCPAAITNTTVLGPSFEVVSTISLEAMKHTTEPECAGTELGAMEPVVHDESK